MVNQPSQFYLIAGLGAALFSLLSLGLRLWWRHRTLLLLALTIRPGTIVEECLADGTKLTVRRTV